MSNQESLLDMLDRAENQRSARRSFIRMCGGVAAMGGGLAMLSGCGDDDDDDISVTPTPTPTPAPSTGVTDIDILNFALSLEYLEGNYYSYAVSGAGIPTGLQTGVGTQGAVATGSGAGAARAVPFTDQVVAQFAREIAADEIAHITFLRTALGSAAAAQPAINLSGSASVTIGSAATVGAFTAAARAAGVIGPGDIFDPFANDENFLIGSYLLTDVGVTAYRGSARLITNKVFLEASAGILATEAYHDGVIRASLYTRGLAAPTLFTRIQQISDARDGLDGPTDTDQGIGNATEANLVPTDANSLALGRTAPQVLNVVYNNRAAVSQGGFFPAGVNGAIRTSAAN
jgi:hypothetical protein